MFPTPIEKTSRSTQLAYKAGVPLVLLMWLLPLLAVLLTSARSLEDIIAGNYWGMPTEIRIAANYRDVFANTPMLTYLKNSALITLPTVFGVLCVSSLSGFALAKYRFRGNTLLFAFFIGGNFIPFQILMIPVREMTIATGLFNTLTGLVIFHIAFQTGFCTLFLRGFIRTIPDSLLETSRIDGASEFLIFRQIILPLIRPALAALAVLEFTFIWNDYFWSLVLLQSDTVRPVTAGLMALRGQWISSWNLISAGAIVVALPPVIMFFLMQKHFIAGLTTGAVKE
jgi:multiple sugar transport system permease protein